MRAGFEEEGGSHVKTAMALVTLLLLVPATAAGSRGREKVFGRVIEFTRSGSGSPPVVMFSGLGNTMSDWRRIQRAVAESTTTFAFNRPGYGYSTLSRRPRTGASIVEETHELLAAAGLTAPYVLVGHSVGGLYANLYARTYPGEVCGVVLVDASHPDQLERFATMRPTFTRVMEKLGFVMGLLIPADPRLAARGIGGGPVIHQESRGLEVTSRQVKEAAAFPDVPLVVITATRHRPNLFPESEWQALQADLVAMSPRGRQVLAEKSGHFVHHDQPALVIQAIREVVAAAR
jgi:pimeloyl-ACP methyl ester carboxylesterase